MDENGDGVVTMPEFKTGMRKVCPTLKEAQLEQIFNNIDMDDSRGITIDELITAISHRALVDEDERLYQTFLKLDRDQDGLITQTELKSALKQVIGDIDENKSERPELMHRIKMHIRTHTKGKSDIPINVCVLFF